MKTEFEVKILNIDKDLMRDKLLKLGANEIGLKEMKRCIYDFNPMRPDAWIRLRNDGRQSTLTIKERSNDQIDGTKELEVVVSSFEDTNGILEKLGYSSRLYQENRRRSFELDGIQIEIDEWPMIPPYLEVEWQSIEEVESMVAKLGYGMSDTTAVDTEVVYNQYGLDLNTIPHLHFWL